MIARASSGVATSRWRSSARCLARPTNSSFRARAPFFKKRLSSRPTRTWPPRTIVIVVIGSCIRDIPATTYVAVGGSWLRMCSRFSGVAGTPPSTPITSWKCAGSLTSPESINRLPCWTNPTSNASSSGLMFCSSIAFAKNWTVSGVFTYTTDGLRPAKLSVPVVSEPISGFVRKGVARSSSVWPAMPLVEVITTSFVRLRIFSTVSRKMSNRDVGRSSSSRQWTWMIAAPSCSHRYAVSAISSGVTGTCGVSFFRGTEPVGATVMMSLSMPSAGACTASIRSKGLWPPRPRGSMGDIPSLREQVARHLHIGCDGLELGLREFVERHPDPAVRPLALQDDALPPAVRVRDRHDRHKGLRVRVPRILDELSSRAFLDDLPQVHDPDAVREDPCEREVVGDEQVCEALLLAQLEEELQDLCANRDIEHRDGFVGDQELRVQDERSGDRHALSLSSGELVRIPEQEVPRRPQARIGDRLLDPGFRLRAVPAQAVHDERFRDDVVHRMLRIQRLVRILEDDLELLPQAANLDSLESFLPQAVPNEDPADEDGHPDGEEIAAQHREGLIPPDPRLIQSAGVDVTGEHEAEVGAQVEREHRQPSEDQGDSRRRPGRWHAPEVRDERRDDDAVADVAPAVCEGQMEHGCRDEGRDGRCEERSDREEDPQEDELRDGPRPMLFPGERVLPPDGLQVRGACARLRRLVLVQDGLRHVDEDVATGRRDELQDPLAGRRLATAALPDEAEDLPPPDVEVDAIDRADVFRRGFPQRLEESSPLLEPDAEVSQDEIRLAGHLTSPPSAAGAWCSGGMRRNGRLRPGRGRVPGRRTAARRTCTADGSGTRGAG